MVALLCERKPCNIIVVLGFFGSLFVLFFCLFLFFFVLLLLFFYFFAVKIFFCISLMTVPNGGRNGRSISERSSKNDVRYLKRCFISTLTLLCTAKRFNNDTKIKHIKRLNFFFSLLLSLYFYF